MSTNSTDKIVVAAPILIVDDSRAIRSFVERALTAAGYRVLTAADGVEALHIAHKTPLALILLDSVMPTLDGIATAQQLRAAPATAQIPRVLISGERPDDLALFCAILPKPFTIAALVEYVQRYQHEPNPNEARERAVGEI